MDGIRSVLLEGDRETAFSDAAFVRNTVFIEEQGFSEDLDELDGRSVHLIFYREDAPIAAARAFSEGGGTWHIGRVAVLKELRGTGLGARVMRRMEQALIERGATRLILGAQLHAVPFYEKLGFCRFGDRFDDAGAPHQMMEKRT